MKDEGFNCLSEYTIVVNTKYFGYNFTGATLSTHELVKIWSKYVKEIIIVTRKVGEYDELDNLKIKVCKNSLQVVKEIKNLNCGKKFFYSDDHTAFLLVLANVNYFHTYHASWPMAKKIDLKYYVKSFGFIPLYKMAFYFANAVIGVSNKSTDFIKKYNKKYFVIRNGIGRNRSEIKDITENKIDIDNDVYKILMIGHIDKNKYFDAIKIFEMIEKYEIKVQIDIYGRSVNNKIANNIEKFDFVNLKGYSDNIKINNYDLLMNTSKNENLSIAACEALELSTPVISFNVGAMGEIIISGDNGFLIETGNVSKYYEILKCIVESKYNFEFKNQVLKDFTWESSALNYLKVFLN